jgi:hypothetical protein
MVIVLVAAKIVNNYKKVETFDNMIKTNGGHSLFGHRIVVILETVSGRREAGGTVLFLKKNA